MTDHQKTRLAWWTLVAVGFACVVAGIYLLTAGPKVFGGVLIAAGVIGILGMLDLRKHLFRP
jgi:uncharacterized membrane protein HdeD (DUF308 family)